MPRRLPETLINDIDDGLPLLSVKKHTHEKLVCLLRHYAFFTRIVNARSPKRRRWYVDLFSGPGKCRTEETGEIKKGSPLIASATKPPFTDFVFVEENPDYLNALKQRTSHLASSCRYLNGDANTLVQEVVHGVDDYDPCFVFLDPFELELEWNTVAELARKPRIDMMINFQVSQIFRAFGLQSYNRLEKFFGPNDWRSVERRWHESVSPVMIRSELFELYRSGLEKHGLSATPKLIYTESTNLPLYYLIYAVRFPVGEKVWKEIAKPKISRYRTLDDHEVVVYE